jgi:hypothetical protein
MCFANYSDATVDPDGVVTPPGPEPSSVSSVPVLPSDRTKFLLKGLRCVLKHHGALEQIRDEYCRQATAYLEKGLSAPEDEEEWVKRCKYMLSYPLAAYLKNTLPPSPPCGPFQPHGFLRRWLKTRTKVFSRKNTHLWYSIFQLKRCTIPFSEQMVQKTYEKHLASLTKTHILKCGVRERIMNNRWFKGCLSYIKSKLKKVYAFENYDEEAQNMTFEKPSQNACFERTRSKGGQVAHLRENYAKLPSLLGLDELHSMKYCPIESRVIEIRQISGSEHWDELHSQVQELVRNGEYNRPLNATIQGVLEPNKCRVISKGESLPYYAMKELQKALHGIMRNIPCFRLIGQTFCPTMVIDLVPEQNPEDYEWFSVDYSAATDELNALISNLILTDLLEDYSIAAYLAKKVLGPHALYYPDPVTGKPVYRGLQSVGQLMGSILSFPVLCLANLAVYFANVADRPEFLKKTWQEVSKKVLVNGDDMLYAGKPHEWDRHIEISGDIGLNMSVGKAYRHKVYSNVNSTSVHYDLRRRDTPYQIDFLNTGLFYGVRKVQGESSNDETPDRDTSLPFSKLCNGKDFGPGSIGEAIGRSFRHWKLLEERGARDSSEGFVASIPRLLKGSLPGRQKDLLISYLKENKVQIQTESLCLVRADGKTRLRTRNLFLPEVFGGMGVPLISDWKFRISVNDRKLATSLYRSHLSDGRLRCSQLPLVGKEYIKVEVQKQMPWQTYDSLPSFPSFVQEGGSYFSKKFFRGLLGTVRVCRNFIDSSSSFLTPSFVGVVPSGLQLSSLAGFPTGCITMT